MKSSVLGIRDFKPSGCLYWALANKLVIVLTLMIPVLLLVVSFRPFRVEDLGSALSAPSGLPCNNNNINNRPMTDENLGGDKHGGLVDVLLSALQSDGNPHIRFYQTQTVPTFPMFVCENCKCDICNGVVGLGYFAPVETSIFRHILGGNGGCHHDDAGGGAHHHLQQQQQQQLVVDVGANVGYFSAYATALGCRVASFEPNRNPRRYLEASAALQDPQHHTWKIYPLAIGKEEKRVNFTEEESWGVSHITKRKLMEVADQEVEVVLLDTIVKEDVLLLKVDTEGYEAMVIGGSHNVLKNHNVQNVVVEVKNFNEHDVRDFLFDLKDSGHFTHVYNYLEEYFKPMDLSVFSLDQATMYDVTDIVANKRYEQELKHEDFWFRKEPFKSLNV
ncbi:hypothetical protein CY35_01G066400 [Sphagnum magellanicum]|nr:hypothetical protein CY35_01G066400 [Sphagnum magellanicum]